MGFTIGGSISFAEEEGVSYGLENATEDVCAVVFLNPQKEVFLKSQ